MDKLVVLPFRADNERDVRVAVELYRDTTWAPCTVPILPVDACFAALSAPDSVWHVIKDKGELVCLSGLERIRAVDRVAEPYIAINPTYRRKGNAMRFAPLLLDFYSREYNIRRLQAQVLDEGPTHKVLREAGFKEEGRLRKCRWKGGKYIDVVVMGWLKEK